MTIYVNQQDAEKTFTQLISKVLDGEEIIILINGKEIAKILPCKNEKVEDNTQNYRKAGLLKGKLGELFFEPLPEEELKLWEQDI